jgi:sterol desaturase/sphingolipid hydroxylase (fatty acid hydroxylase superfamily)
MRTWQLIVDGYTGYARYLCDEITFGYAHKPWYENYFWALVGVSLLFFALEGLRPWRKDQPRFRKDFWLDAFYMFFNFFLFSLIVYNAASLVVVDAVNRVVLGWTGVDLAASNPMADWPRWAVFATGFVVADFIQWNTHRLLHRVPWLWRFHQVHHSVEQMGFAAHLRYHWMETVVYKSIQYLPLALLGIGLYDFFWIHILQLAIGHFNHANLRADLGPLRYLVNNPRMHIWHHARDLPGDKPYGVNFGISLSLWDYLFGTAYIPRDGRDEPLGYPGMTMPGRFVRQLVHGFRR